MKQISMKRFSLFWAGVLAVLPLVSTVGQGYSFGGQVMQQAGLSPEAMARLSQNEPFGTARAMAMGGAFASLGGDMSSMMINPAGLGMYRSNELVFSPLVSVTRSENASLADYNKNSATRFAPANLGLSFNIYEGTGRVVSVNLALGYNRVVDLNYRTSFQYDSPCDGAQAAPSILRAMAGQLTTNGLYPNNDGFLGYYGDNYPDLWGAMMAYNSYLINPYEDADGPYWEADHVGHNARVGHFYDLESKGSIGEYDLAFGMNINNKFYVGATIGVRTVSQKTHLYYAEDYLYRNSAGDPVAAVNSADEELIEQADYMHYNQASEVSGAGVNFKVGVIYRPIPALRIGMAVHTPTFYSLDYSYAGQMASMSYNNDEQKYYASDVDTDGSWNDMNGDSWRFVTPTRLMFGLSYAWGNKAVLSVDYERDWYNGIRTKNHPFWIPAPVDYRASSSKERFCATNTLRVGLEVKPMERFALRAGFGYTSSMVNNAALCESSPLADRILYYTAGVGFALSRRVTLDVAYQYHRTENEQYRLFYGAYNDLDGSRTLYDASERLTTDYVRHNMALTLAVKF